MGALVEAEPLDAGPPGEGSRFRDVFEEHGQRFEVRAEVVRCVPGELVEIRLAGDAFAGTSTQRLDDLGGRTRLTAAIETEYTNRMLRLLAGVITRRAQSRLEEDLAALKRLVEAS